MARIPKLVDSPRVSTRVPLAPTLSPTEASRGFRETAAISGKIASTLGQLRNRQIAEANKTSYTKASIEQSKGINDTFRQLDSDYEGTNFEGFSKDGMDRMKRRNDEIIKAAPDSIKEQLKLSFDSKMVGFEEKLRSREARRKSEYAIFETNDQLKTASQDAYSSPWNPMQNLENTQALKNLVNTSTQYDERARRGLNYKISNIPKDMVNGVIDRGDITDMSQALSDLKDPDMDLAFIDMDPKDKTRAISRLESRIKSKQNEVRNKLITKQREVIAGLNAGTLNISDPEDREAVSSIKDQISAMMGPDAKQYINDIEIYEDANQFANENSTDIITTDVKERAKIMAKGEKDLITAAALEVKTSKVLSNIQRSRVSEFKKSPADYMVKYDKSIASNALEVMSQDAEPEDFDSMVVSMDNAYDKLGVPGTDRKYLPAQIKNHYGKNIQAMMDEGQYQGAAHILEEFKNKTGNKGYKFYDELEINSDIAVTMEIDDPQQRSIALRNLATYKDRIKPTFSQQYDQSDSEIEKMLIEDDFYKSMAAINAGQGKALKNAQSFLNSAKMEYKRARLNGADEDDAKEAAFAQFKRGYDVVDNGDFPIPVKKLDVHDPKKIENFLDFEGDYTKYLNIDPIKTANGVELTKEEINDNIKNRGKWIYDKSQNGLRLVLRDENGNLSRVNKKGTKQGLIIPLEEVQQIWDKMSTDQEEQEETVRKKQFIRRNFGSRSPYRLMR